MLHKPLWGPGSMFIIKQGGLLSASAAPAQPPSFPFFWLWWKRIEGFCGGFCQFLVVFGSPHCLSVACWPPQLVLWGGHLGCRSRSCFSCSNPTWPGKRLAKGLWVLWESSVLLRTEKCRYYKHVNVRDRKYFYFFLVLFKQQFLVWKWLQIHFFLFIHNPWQLQVLSVRTWHNI